MSPEKSMKKNLRQFLVLILILLQVFSLNGCLIKNVDAKLETAPKLGEGAVTGKVSQNEFPTYQHDVGRFNVEGTNAFYILKGLENDPDYITSFELLDYTDKGEFIYHYTTPSYISANEVALLSAEGKKAEGDVATTGYLDPERKDYPVCDAEILMAYNPDSGHYRVIYSRAYELEWDPVTEKRPSYYTSSIYAGGKNGLIFMEKRAFACRVPGKHQYALMNLDGMGYIFDENGVEISALDFRNDISYQESLAIRNSQGVKSADQGRSLNDMTDEEFEAFIGQTDKVASKSDPDYETPKMIIKDMAMNRDYYTYISCSTYTGSSPIDPFSYLGGSTFLAFSVGLTRKDTGLSDYRCFNVNADKQYEAWKSFDGRYFNSRQEMMQTYGYSMNSLKTEGNYPDSFTPFYYDSGESVSGNIAMDKTGPKSLIVGTVDPMNTDLNGEFTREDDVKIRDLFGITERETVGVATYLAGKKMGYNLGDLSRWWNNSRNAVKRAVRSSHGTFVDRVLRKEAQNGGTYDYFVWLLDHMGLVPRMGEWDQVNKQNDSSMITSGTDPQIFEVLSFTPTVFGTDIPHIAVVDYTSPSAGDYEVTPETERAVPVATSYLPYTERVTWYRSREEAKTLRDLYTENYPQYKDTLNGIRSILLDLESDPDTGKDNVFKVIKELTGDDVTAVAGTLDYLQDMINTIPSADRVYVLNLCLDYVGETDLIREGEIPISYTLKFPSEARTRVSLTVQDNAAAGSTIEGIPEGVLIAHDAERDVNLIGYESDFEMYSGINVASEVPAGATPGSPMDIKEILWEDTTGSGESSYIVYSTSYGIRIFKYDRTTGVGQFTPLKFTGSVKDVYTTFHPDGKYFLDVHTEGFIPYESFFTSSGYTTDTENRAFESTKEVLKDSYRENNFTLDEQASKEFVNSRFSGSIASADAVGLIGPESAIVCSVNGGTLFLNLKSGEVTKDAENGSWYRLIQSGNTNNYKLLGFENSDNKYKDTDLPMAKVYTKVYEDGRGENDPSLVASVKNTLQQMAKDYLYRQYRTDLDNTDTVINIDMPVSENEENISEEKLFASGNPEDTTGEFMTELERLEKLYGLKKESVELNNYLMYLRKQAAAIKPAMTRLYTLAGATDLATSPKREEPYWKNLDSRMTLAFNETDIENILVEIRMHPDAASSLPEEQVKKYESYKPTLDYSAEQGRIDPENVDFLNSLSSNEAEERLRDAEQMLRYREDVLNDIREDFRRLHPDGDFEATLIELLNLVNPENLILAEEEARDEFINVINHGDSVVKDNEYNEMRERMLKAIPDAESVWEMEKLIISEKIRQPKYSRYSKDFEDYEYEEAATEENKRPALLRKTGFYKDIIGGIKNDAFVKDFLASKKETWEDYVKEVILNAGSKVVKDDNGLIEGNPYNEEIKEWRKIAE